MKSTIVKLDKKIIRDFIKKHDPYKKPEPLGVDIRAFLDYVDTNQIDKRSITPELVQKFAK